ncbi:MAG: hypothetical protein M1833_006078 [Piccolia ochrophora]|nr:MAG: hypothetical protein M1833_006078 [Piccolia ochrophora]
MATMTVTKRKLSQSDRLGSETTPASASLGPATPDPKSFFVRAAHWNLEQDYEQQPRKKRKGPKETTRLPIKTAEGTVQPSRLPEVQDASSDSGLGEDDVAARSDDGSPREEDAVEIPKIPLRQQIIEAKEELARVATLVNEDPEEHSGLLKALAQIGRSKNTTIKKLALLTQLAVYKDIIPGYRIRPFTEEEMGAKLSREVRRLRAFEQSLVAGYQTYLRDLAKLARQQKDGSSEDSALLSGVAISCACALALAVPHFNFRGDLLKILVDKLSEKPIDDDSRKCQETIETLFREDDDGRPSLDAVTMLTKMMKSKGYRIDEHVLNTFWHLRLLSEFASTASHDRVDAQQGEDGKTSKQKRTFRTKKQRKLAKENRVIEKEMREADATVSHEDRERLQGEMLKLVFVTYFRILKARTPSLMGAVLEGLAKYAHLINQDFFVDVLEALKDLIGRADASTDSDSETVETETPTSSRNPTRESLLCTITAFALLQGQTGHSASSNSSLNLDLSFFITRLYRTIYPLSLDANLELSSKSLHLPDPSSSTPSRPPTINLQTTAALLIRCLSTTLVPPHTTPRAVPPTRLAGFTKQLMTAALHLPEKSCAATVALLARVAKTHGKKVASLWRTEERRGDGVFEPLRPDVEAANPFAATVWEGELLRVHFCPAVRDGVRALEGVVAGV